MSLSIKNLKGKKAIFFDFDGVFTDNKVIISEDGKEYVFCSREDGMGIGLLSELDIVSYIISTEVNPVVSARAKKLKIPCFQNVEDKAKIVKEICESKGIALRDAIFVGNDINDLGAFSIVGLPIAVKDSHPDVLKEVKAVTKKTGGNGAVREICDMLKKALSK